MSELYKDTAVVAANEPPFGAYRPKGLQAAVLAFAHVPPFYRGALRRPMADLIRALGDSGIVDLTRDGISFRLRNGTNLIEDGILVHPAYNGIEIDFLREGTPEGGTFIDLGANVGLYTLPLAKKVGANGRVLAVDANPDIVKALEFNILASSLENVTIAAVAIGETAGRARLEIRKNDLAIVEVAQDPDGAIEIRPLIDVVRDAGLTRVDSLKADIEGYEDRAILPFLEQVEEAMRPRHIVIEHLTRDVWETDCFPVFERYGYRLAGKTRGNSMFEKG